MSPILQPKNLTRLTGLQILIGLILPVAINAQTIGNWNFNGTTSGTGSAGNSVSIADFSASVPTKTFNGATEYYGQNGWPTGGINTGMYIEFTLTPNSGHYLSIISLTLRMRRSNTGTPSGSGPTSWSIRSSMDGFTSDISSGTMTHNYANYNVLPGGGFGYIPGPVTFRVYGYDVTVGSGGNSRMVFDNITVTGAGPILPVHLLSFSAKVNDQRVQINYELANTEPGTSYILERSTDGNTFTVIDTKNETQLYDHITYSFSDDNLPTGIERIYYRLKLKDGTGRATYSSIVYVLLQNKSRFKARLHDQSLTVTGQFTGKEQIALYDATGYCIFIKKLPVGQTVQFTTTMLSKGVYYLVVQSVDGKQTIPVVAE